MQASRIGQASLSTDLYLSSCNQVFLELMQDPAGLLLGQHWETLPWVQQYPALIEAAHEALQAGTAQAVVPHPQYPYQLHFYHSGEEIVIMAVGICAGTSTASLVTDMLPAAELVEHLPEGILIAEGLEEPLLYANQTLCKQLGYTSECLHQLSQKDLQTTADFLIWKDQLTALIAGRVQKLRDVPLIGADRRPVFAHLQRIPHLQLLSNRYCLLLQDVTLKRQTRLLLEMETHVFEMISATADLSAVLTYITKAVEEILPDALASVLLLQPDGVHVTNGAAPSLPAAYTAALEGAAIGPTVGSCGTAMYTKMPVIVTDISTDYRWKDYKQLALAYDLQACWSHPIADANSEVKGAFALYYRSTKAPLDRDLEVIKQASRLATLAMERLQDHDNLEKAVRQLAENEQYYRILFDTSPLGMVAMVPYTEQLLVNKRFKELTGYDNESAESLNGWWELAYPDELYRQAIRKSWEESLQASLANGRPGPSYDARFKCADGEYKHFRVQVVAADKFWISSFLDITEQVRQQDRLARQSSLQQLLMHLASRFINVPREQLDHAINEMLAEVGANLGTDRTVVYRYEFDQQHCKLTHEWCANSILPSPTGSRLISFADMALYAIDLLSGRRTSLTACSSTSNIHLQQWMQQLAIGSLAAVPLLHAGRSIGFIAFHSTAADRLFDSNELALLRVMSEILSNAIAKVRSEEALRVSEKDFRALFNNMSQGVVYQDRSGKIIKANHAAADILGLSHDELFGRTSIDSRWQAIKENGEPFSGENHPSMMALRTGKAQENVMMGVYSPRHQNHRWILVSSKPEFRPHETVAYRAFTTFTDVTQIKELENTISVTEQQYRMLFENNPSPMWVYHPETLQIVRVNETAVKEYGYSREEFLNMTLADLRPVDEVPRLQEAVHTRQDGLNRSEGWHHIKKNGEAITVEIISHTVEYNGEKHVLVLANDITQRRQIEAALQESENRYRSILDLSPAGIFIMKDQRVHFVNKTGMRMMGAQQVEQVMGLPLAKIVPPYELAASTERLSRLENGDRTVYPADGEIMRLDGSCVSVELMAGLMETAEGKVIQVIATDISDRKSYLEALEHQNKLLREIAWTQSHVVRAPLTRLLSLLPLHKKFADDEAAQTANIQNIRTAAEELDRVITSIAERSYALTNLESLLQGAPQQALPVAHHNTLQTLIVDDDQLIQQVHELMVVDNGFAEHPMVFANGSTALAHIRQHDQEGTSFLVLLDINMPVMNGWEFLEALAITNLSSQVLVVIVTSSVDMADRLKAQRYAHVIDYVTKPVDDLVLDTIKRHQLVSRYFTS